MEQKEKFSNMGYHLPDEMDDENEDIDEMYEDEAREMMEKEEK